MVAQLIRAQLESLHPGRAAPLGVASADIEAYLARQFGLDRAARNYPDI